MNDYLTSSLRQTYLSKRKKSIPWAWGIQHIKLQTLFCSAHQIIIFTSSDIYAYRCNDNPHQTENFFIYDSAFLTSVTSNQFLSRLELVDGDNIFAIHHLLYSYVSFLSHVQLSSSLPRKKRLGTITRLKHVDNSLCICLCIGTMYMQSQCMTCVDMTSYIIFP